MTGHLHVLPRPHGILPGRIIHRRLRIIAGQHWPAIPVHRTLFEGHGK